MKQFDMLNIKTREEIGYTEADARIVYETACSYAAGILREKQVCAAYLIGSFAAGSFTPERSDIDLLAFYNGPALDFTETAVPVTLRSGEISRDINVSVCIRPLSFLDYWKTVPERLRDGILWKEINAYEDYLMAKNHGILVYGEDLLDRLPPCDPEAYSRYLRFRTQLSAPVCESEQLYPNIVNVAKTIISMAREAVFIWTGRFLYSVHACLDWFASEKTVPAAQADILRDAVRKLDRGWTETLQSERIEVLLMKIIRNCIKFKKWLCAYEREQHSGSLIAELLEQYSYIPYNFPPCAQAFERLIAADADAAGCRNVRLLPVRTTGKEG